MTQVLHIFRKDVRCLRWELAVVAALTVAFVWSHVVADTDRRQVLSTSMGAYLISGLLVIGWWFLITQLVHDEALVGHRQFWITRPYSWRQLLSAKVLFILVCINAPLLVAQMVILSAGGYPPLAGFPKLLWMQFAVTIVLLVPAFALATVTRNLGQFVPAALGVFLCWYILVGLRRNSELSDAEWAHQTAAMAVACAGIMLVVHCQYAKRRTEASVIVCVCTLLLGGALYIHLPYERLPIALRYAAQFWMFGPPEPAVSIVLAQPLAAREGPDASTVVIEPPFTLTDIPTGATATPALINVDIATPSSVHWSSGWVPLGCADLSFSGVLLVAPECHWQPLVFKRDVYRRIAAAKATLRASLYLSVRNKTTVPLPPGRATRVPGDAFCAVSDAGNQYAVFCSSPFRPPYEMPSGRTDTYQQGSGEKYTRVSRELLSRRQFPWPADFVLSPVFTMRDQCELGCTIIFTRDDPPTLIRRDLEATVRLPPMPEATP